MPKARYRALVGLSYPTDKKILDRIAAGEKLTWKERKNKEVAAGEIVYDIPEISIPWLLEQGKIEEVKFGEEEKGRKILSNPSASEEGESEEGEVT